MLLMAALASGCAGLPPLTARPATYAVEPATDGPLARMISPLVHQHPARTGVVPISDGHAAFGARVALVRSAARSIDIQTYIWDADATGSVLMEEVLRAAERGVRVRLLIDDLNTSGLDPMLALLASQPNLQLRLYNPFVSRGARAFDFLGDFTRLNRRMHNKSFTIDNLVTVVGGRNIADEYYEAAEQTDLVDLDVVAIGDAVKDVSTEFDLYWNSAAAYPSQTILARVEPESRESLARRARIVRDDPALARFGEVVQGLPLVKDLLEGSLDPEWVEAAVVYDDPSKTQSREADKDQLLLPRLHAALGNPTRSLDLVSPYFVPGVAGVEALAALVRSGVRVRVLTNSLAATDQKSVHAGYSKRRVALLRAGIELLELKPDARSILARSKDIGRGSKAGLHAKTYAVDGRAIFVGSFNLDPRSSRLNTEMGMVIQSPALATRLATAMDRAYPSQAYRLDLDHDGRIRWHDAKDGVYTTDPGASWWARAIVEIGTWLPIEWLL